MASLPSRGASPQLRVNLPEKKGLDCGFWEEGSAGGSLAAFSPLHPHWQQHGAQGPGGAQPVTQS